MKVQGNRYINNPEMKMCIRDRNILDLVDKAVEDSGKVPKEFKQQMKNWIHDLVSTMSTLSLMHIFLRT